MKKVVKSLLFMRIAVGVAALLGAIGTVGTVWAGTDVGNGMPVGIVGLTHGQTARVNVLLHPPGPVFPPDPVVPPDPVHPPGPVIPCRPTLQFYNMQGEVLAETTVREEDGHLAYFDLNGDTLNQIPRHQIYAVVRVEDADGTGIRSCRDLWASLELIDNDTGRTTEVSGLTRTTEVVEHREGDEP